MLIGPTFFAGDSITVGLAPFVLVSGERITNAVGGRSVVAIEQAVGKDSNLARAQNMVVLGGTNDIGSSMSATAIFGHLQAIWKMGKDKGIRVIALTIPPVKGYPGFVNNYDTVNAKRHTVNDLIKASNIPDKVVDLDILLGDPNDHEKLAANADAGDHLHPRKNIMGAALDTAFVNMPAPPPVTNSRIAPTKPTSPLIYGGAAAAAAAAFYFWKRTR